MVKDYSEGWWRIERAEHDGREWYENIGTPDQRYMQSAYLGDCAIEGSSHEMASIADAIETRTAAQFKRVAVICMSDNFELWSPKLSRSRILISHDDANDLAADIRRKLAAARTASTNDA